MARKLKVLLLTLVVLVSMTGGAHAILDTQTMNFPLQHNHLVKWFYAFRGSTRTKMQDQE